MTGHIRRVTPRPGFITAVQAALPTLPGINQLPGIRKTSQSLPTHTLQRTAQLALEPVSAYAGVCGFEKPTRSGIAPLTYLHLLAFPLHMAMLTSAEFPFPALGTVHLSNRIRSHRPVPIGEQVQVELRAERLGPHPKGTTFDLVAAATIEGELVWESTSRYLRLGADSGSSQGSNPGTGSSETAATRSELPGPGMPWRLGADLGRRYAAISGDHNPIHLYPLTAKAFGFRRQIAHGMWTKARCVAALEHKLPSAVEVEVDFKKPILLPAKVHFTSLTAADRIEFEVHSGKPHLVGSATGC